MQLNTQQKIMIKLAVAGFLGFNFGNWDITSIAIITGVFFVIFTLVERKLTGNVHA